MFDSSVWISAFQFGGNPLSALRIASRGRIAICEPIRDEVCDILAAKFSWSERRVQMAFDELRLSILYVPIPGQLHGVCRDPKDDMILECAAKAGAAVIITGDQDLLALREFQGIRILTPRAFLDEFPAPPLP